MQKLNILLLTFFFLCIYSIGWSQTEEPTKPWVINVSSHFLNTQATQSSKFSDYSSSDQYYKNWGPTKLSVIKSISNSFSIGPSISVGSIETSKYNQPFFLQGDLSLQLTMANGKILPVYSRFEPYLQLGGGFQEIASDTKGLVNGGGGLNIWLTSGFGLNLQTTYNAGKILNYWQNSVGLSFRLGSKGEKIVDRDGDGIVDKLDKCPDEPGTAATNGCPDADGDGIANADDACPDQAGKPEFKGCPDTDGDGITDKEDACPKEAGKLEFKGCSDTDGDGIIDKEDGCPTEKGTAANKGCPDTDGDGIVDKEDGCPTEKGTAANKGCPDRDSDKVIDKEDACPDQAGTIANKGCPELKAEELKKIQMAAASIQFENGKANILKTSYPKLDIVFDVMKKNPSTSFIIEGHSDNVGNPAANKALSQKRADAVQKYFTDKGIPEYRLDSQGYGSEKPIADNKTTAGKAKNRRVEIKVTQ